MTLLEQVKQNLILTHSEDDALLVEMIAAATSYAEGYQHKPAHTYAYEDFMPPATRQAIVMLASHFYESRDGATAGFWNDKPQAVSGVWAAVNNLLRLDRDWKI